MRNELLGEWIQTHPHPVHQLTFDRNSLTIDRQDGVELQKVAYSARNGSIDWGITKGIYKVDGDVLHLCFDESGQTSEAKSEVGSKLTRSRSERGCSPAALEVFSAASRAAEKTNRGLCTLVQMTFFYRQIDGDSWKRDDEVKRGGTYVEVEVEIIDLADAEIRRRFPGCHLFDEDMKYVPRRPTSQV